MSQLTTNTASLQAILEQVNALPERGNGEPVLQAKTVTPTASAQTVTPDSGYDGLSAVYITAIADVEQAEPSITFSSSALITATVKQSTGYVSGGTKTATKQLTRRAATYIMPGTSDQIIRSGRYLTGDQTIRGDANLVPANIAEGVSIFGVTGTHSGGSASTATVTITSSAPSEGGVYYVTADGREYVDAPEFGESVSLTCVVPSFLCSTIMTMSYNIDGPTGTEMVHTEGDTALIYITGDTSIDVMG